MIAAGVDIGSTTTKAVILEDERIRSSVLLATGNLPARTASRVMEVALERAGLSESDVAGGNRDDGLRAKAAGFRRRGHDGDQGVRGRGAVSGGAERADTHYHRRRRAGYEGYLAGR